MGGGCTEDVSKAARTHSEAIDAACKSAAANANSFSVVSDSDKERADALAKAQKMAETAAELISRLKKNVPVSAKTEFDKPSLLLGIGIGGFSFAACLMACHVIKRKRHQARDVNPRTIEMPQEPAPVPEA